MTAARRRALAVVLAGVAVSALFLLALHGRPARKPDLMLLTSLPLQFGEGFGVGDVGSPALKALSEKYRVMPISTSSAAELAKGRLLLMAQPPAQSPQNLVALDNWVRGGGRVLLLADPMLEWPSDRPLGDPLRPQVMFSDTGLLAHWGLRLDSPDRLGPAQRTLAGQEITVQSPGTLHGGCEIAPDGLVADCSIGRGRAVVVADADVLDGRARGSADALHAVVAMLGSLSRA